MQAGDEPIAIDADAEVVEIFVSMVTQIFGADQRIQWKVKTVAGLLDLGERYECPVIARSLRLQFLNERPGIDARDLFLFAARMDSLDLAKKAIIGMSHFNQHTFTPCGWHKDPQSEQVWRYIWAYLRAGVQCWEELAARFECATP